MVARLLAIALILLGSALAREAVEDYSVEIWVAPDAALNVQEVLLVRAENVAIRHGIYRDLWSKPAAAVGAADRQRITYEILGARLDGRPVPWKVVRTARGVRIYLGDKDRLLTPGLHRFSLKYRAEHALLAVGEKRTQLYWNVTGNEWRIPIHRVRLFLHLPPSLSAEDVAARVFFGALGATGSRPLAALDRHTLSFVYEGDLPPGSGLTLQAEWPADLLAAPPAPRDPVQVLALLGLLATVALGGFAWLAVGRDPQLGPVIPRFEPPPGLSAPAAAYLLGGGYGTRVFSAAVAELARRGLVNVVGGDKPVLRKSGSTPDEKLPRELRDFYNALFAAGPELALEPANAEHIKNAQDALKGLLSLKVEPLVRNNSGYSLAVQALAATTLGWLGYRAADDFSVAVFAAVGFVIYATFAKALLRSAALAWERYRLIPGLSPLADLAQAAAALLAVLITASFFGLAFGVSLGFAVGVLAMLLALAGALAGYLIPAYTKEGVRLRNHLLGLARYLGTTDEAALRWIGAPEDVPQSLSLLFPYAVALGLEVPFGRRIASFTKLHPEEARQVIVWNRPASSFGTGGGASFVDYTSSISDSLRTAVARVQTSGGGGGGFSGGGFSGGGGGGGGGGGW